MRTKNNRADDGVVYVVYKCIMLSAGGSRAIQSILSARLLRRGARTVKCESTR